MYFTQKRIERQKKEEKKMLFMEGFCKPDGMHLEYIERLDFGCSGNYWKLRMGARIVITPLCYYWA